jgi:hypothetical protein
MVVRSHKKKSYKKSKGSRKISRKGSRKVSHHKKSPQKSRSKISRKKQYTRGKGTLDFYYGAVSMLGLSLGSLLAYYTKYKSEPIITRMVEQQRLADETELLLDKLIALKLKSGEIYRKLGIYLTVDPKKSGEWIRYLDEDPKLYGELLKLLNNFSKLNALIYGVYDDEQKEGTTRKYIIAPNWIAPSASLAIIEDRVKDGFVKAEDWEKFIQHIVSKSKELQQFVEQLVIKAGQPGAVSGEERFEMEEQVRKIGKMYTQEFFENLPPYLKQEITAIATAYDNYKTMASQPRGLSVQNLDRPVRKTRTLQLELEPITE